MGDDFEWLLIEIFCKNFQSLLFLLSYSFYYGSNILLLTPIDIRRKLFWILQKEGVEKIDSEELSFMRIDQTTILFLFHNKNFID